MTNSEEPSVSDGISSMKVSDAFGEQNNHLHHANFGNYVNGDIKQSLENGTNVALPSTTAASGPAYVARTPVPSSSNNCDPENYSHQLPSSSSSIGVQHQHPILPFSLIHGEELEHKTEVSDGNLVLTNYRLFLQTKDATYNLPLGLIESIECRDIFFLHINCKDARCVRCTFQNNEATLEMLKRIQAAIAPTKKIEDNFAFEFFKTTNENVSEEIRAQLGLDLGEFPSPRERFDAEVKRMEFNVQGPWRVSDENKDYELCSSYPTHIIVPCVMDKKKLEQVAGFRSSRRFPAVVWRHKRNGAVISRCSQPEVGWFGWRSGEDEELVQNIVLACADNNGKPTIESHYTIEPKTRNFSGDSSCDSVDGASPHIGACGSLSSLEVVPEPPQNIKKLLILDARSYSTAVVNRARGGGCECLEYYTNCEIQFMNLANIHSIRKSFINVRQLCSLPSDQANNNWFSQLDSCKWLQHMSGLMKAAVTVATAIEHEARPVMVHCSDGWDRTPQIVALAEILLDPYYRSLEGFQVLVEREWLDFGHKFADRCGQGIGSDDTNERCPVFLQWLDCLHQLIKQFPTAFEFNLTFLVKLAQHTYSNLFGTFLCNTAKERQTFKIPKLTHSIWRFLRAPANYGKFRNNLYSSCDKVLWPCCEVRKLKLWAHVYLGYDNPLPVLTEVINPSQDSSPAPSVAAGSETSERISNYRSLEKSKARSSSCENLHMSPTGELQRRQSHPNLSDSFLGMDANDIDGRCLPHTETMLSAASKDIEDCDIVVTSPGANEYEMGKHSSNSGDIEDNSENDDTETNSEEKSDATVINLLKSIESSTDTLVAETCTMAEPFSHSQQFLKEVNYKTENLDCRNARNEISRKTESESIIVNNDADNSKDVEINDFPLIKMKSADRTESGVPTTTLKDLTQTMSEFDILGNQNHHCEVCATSIKLLHGDDIVTNSVTLNGAHANHVSSLNNSSGNGSKFFNYNTPMHSRTPSTGVPATPDECSNQSSKSGYQEKLNCESSQSTVKSLYDVDGLQPLHDEVQSRLNVIISVYRGQIDRLSNELQMYRNTLMRQLGHKCAQHKSDQQDDAVSVADSLCENNSVGHDSHSSEISWEAIDEKDTRPQLWLPDYAVTQCMGCDATFWLGKRKHHCRACGKVFCDECSEYRITIPCEQFFDPVRVCSNCYSRLMSNQGRTPSFNGNCSLSQHDAVHQGTNGIQQQRPQNELCATGIHSFKSGRMQRRLSEELPRSHLSQASKSNTDVSVHNTGNKPMSSKTISNGVHPHVHNCNGHSVSTNGHSFHQ